MRTHPATRILVAACGLILVSGARARAADVTFRVNMAVQTDAQNFYPGFDTVELRGAFDGWGAGIALVPSQADAELYEGTVDLAGGPGAVVDYKFLIHQSDDVLVWEQDGLGPEGAQNRQIEVPDAPTTLPVVFFNNETSVPGDVAVTFQVNLAIQALIGNFDPALHTVEVRGSFDGWGAGAPLAASPEDVGLYRGVADIFGSAGSVVQYKFVINQAGPIVWEGNVGPGGATGNRTFVLEQVSQTLPVEYFDNVTRDPGAGTEVTFTVNLGVRAAHGLFDPEFDVVTVAGQFNNWSTSASPLANRPDDPYIYRGTYTIKASPGSSAPYKYLVNEAEWEEGDNRTFIVADAEQTLPVAYFNREDNLGAVVIASVADGKMTLEWPPGPGVRLQTSSGPASAWVDVPGTDDRDSATLPIGADNAFFRLTGP